MPDAWIRQFGDPVLRLAARPVTGGDATLRAQLRRMAVVLDQAAGAGLAAPQVGILRRAFVFRLSPEGPVATLVNPVVAAASSERAWSTEGCLSFNDIVVTVERAAAVRVEGHDLDGHEVVLDAEGFAASLLQHEIDHLDGVLTLDRAEPLERRRAFAALAGVAPGRRAAA